MRLRGKLWVGEQRAPHHDQVGVASPQDLLGEPGSWMRPTTITGTPDARFTAAAAARLCASPKLEPVTISS